ncbi:MAG: type II toxin-antitoxin system VapC family toxin [Candidatus Heimdallarchaeota archaeon]
MLDQLKRLNNELATTALNLEEILYGIYKRTPIQKLPEDHFLWQLPTLPFTAKDADIAARMEVELERQGQKKPRSDILIAAIALNHKCKLFTLNKKHFSEISKLQLV